MTAFAAVFALIIGCFIGAIIGVSGADSDWVRKCQERRAMLYQGRQYYVVDPKRYHRLALLEGLQQERVGSDDDERTC